MVTEVSVCEIARTGDGFLASAISSLILLASSSLTLTDVLSKEPGPPRVPPPDPPPPLRRPPPPPPPPPPLCLPPEVESSLDEANPKPTSAGSSLSSRFNFQRPASATGGAAERFTGSQTHATPSSSQTDRDHFTGVIQPPEALYQPAVVPQPEVSVRGLSPASSMSRTAAARRLRGGRRS
jgi:hypothetical protein